MASSSDSAPSPGQTSLALLVIRIAAGLVFLYHGSAILFGAFGGPGPQGFAAFMHAPAIMGYLVGLAQFAGGIAILTGLFIRVGAICIIIVMIRCATKCHQSQFSKPNSPLSKSAKLAETTRPRF